MERRRGIERFRGDFVGSRSRSGSRLRSRVRSSGRETSGRGAGGVRRPGARTGGNSLSTNPESWGTRVSRPRPSIDPSWAARSPDTARYLTGGIPAFRRCPFVIPAVPVSGQGDLRSRSRRGQETRAERDLSTNTDLSINPVGSAGSPDPARVLTGGSPRVPPWSMRPPRVARVGAGRPPVAEPAGSGDPRRRGGNSLSGRGPRPGRGSPDPARSLTAVGRGSPDPARVLTGGLPEFRGGPCGRPALPGSGQGDLRSRSRRGQETRAERGD